MTTPDLEVMLFGMYITRKAQKKVQDIIKGQDSGTEAYMGEVGNVEIVADVPGGTYSKLQPKKYEKNKEGKKE